MLRFLWLLLLWHAKELRDLSCLLLLGAMQSKAQEKGDHKSGELKIKARQRSQGDSGANLSISILPEASSWWLRRELEKLELHLLETLLESNT